MDIVRERYDMAISRINEIAGESLIKEPYGDYFRRTAKFICHLDNIYQKIISGEIKKLELRELERINYDLYSDVYNENYSESYAWGDTDIYFLRELKSTSGIFAISKPWELLIFLFRVFSELSLLLS